MAHRQPARRVDFTGTAAETRAAGRAVDPPLPAGWSFVRFSTPAMARGAWGAVGARGDARTLLCDFDTQRAPRLRRLWGVLGHIGVRPVAIGYERSHSGKWHVEIKTERRLTSGEQVAAQMALGSDPWRERHNLARVICGARRDDWNLLFLYKLE